MCILNRFAFELAFIYQKIPNIYETNSVDQIICIHFRPPQTEIKHSACFKLAQFPAHQNTRSRLHKHHVFKPFFCRGSLSKRKRALRASVQPMNIEVLQVQNVAQGYVSLGMITFARKLVEWATSFFFFRHLKKY